MNMLLPPFFRLCCSARGYRRMHLRSRWWLALLYCKDPVSRSATTPKVETRASCLLSRAF
ncbi:hypothetical protein SCEN_J01660 [Saccharomyces cerevisiae]|nr:hypothetical protein SCEN_J01660 [Saccharomyces cerevisiae]